MEEGNCVKSWFFYQIKEVSFALAARVSSLRQREFETEKENENVFFFLYFFF